MKTKIKTGTPVVIVIFGILIAGCSDSAKVNKYFERKEDRQLVLAAFGGREADVDKLLRDGICIDCSGVDGTTPLLASVMASNKHATNLLLKKGANPNLLCDARYSPMNIAAGMKDSWFLETLLKSGGEVNLRNKLKETPIFQAISAQNISNIDMLIKAGANINAQDVHGDTPMIYAANLNQFDIVYHLLQLGADPTIQDNWHYTVLNPIQHNGIDPASPLFKDREKVITWLKERNLWRIEDDRKK